MVLRVQGRSKELVAQTCPTDGTGAIIRIDDDANPEFWAEVHLSDDELRMLLAHLEPDDDLPAYDVELVPC